MKKLLAAILLVVMVFSFASCGVTKSEAPTFDYLYNTGEGHKAIGEYLQSALSAAGLTMTLTNQEWNTFLNTRKDGDYMVARNGWLADYSDPISFLDMWTSGSGNNDVQFGKGAHATLAMYDLDLTDIEGYTLKVNDGTWAQTYDELIKLIKACTDTNKRYQLMHKAEDMIMDTGCIVPLYYYTDIFMIDDAVKGFFANPLGYKYFMYTTIEGKNSINVCLSSEPDTIDPALNSAVDGATMLAHLFQGLAKWSQKADGTLEIVADAAVSLPEGVVNADGTVTYTYTLRDGLKWSNGEAVTAGDFEYSWKRAASNALAADYGYMFEVVKGYGEDDANGLSKIAVTAKDAKTLEVTLANSVSYWNELLAFPTYYPVHKATVASESWATEAATYVCNGPYTISAWDHNSCITLTKNTNFIDAASITMPEIKCFLSDDANNMLTNFKNGTWQLIDDVPTNEIANLEVQYPNEYKVTGQIGTYYVNFNVNADLLPNNTELTGAEKEKAQQEIRKAIGLLLDRNYICEEIGQAGQVAAPAFVPMGMTDPATGDEFYKNTGFSDKFDGYYDVSEDAYEANVNAAIETLKKYYTIEVAE